MLLQVLNSKEEIFLINNLEIGVRRDVSKAPLWMKNLVEKPLVDANILPKVYHFKN